VHLALAPSRRLMRILSSIVLAQALSWHADNPISDFAAA
jgi:hypothetical protein